jgi:hypothetical protein
MACLCIIQDSISFMVQDLKYLLLCVLRYKLSLFELRIVTENHYSIDKSILSTKGIS